MKRMGAISALLICMAVAPVSVAQQRDVQISDDFIAGFLAGAQITDDAIIKRLDSEGEQRSDFFERAFKTRVGDRAKPVPATYYAGFCIPDEEAVSTVVTHVKQEIGRMTQEEGVPNNADLVYKALRSRYPC